MCPTSPPRRPPDCGARAAPPPPQPRAPQFSNDRKEHALKNLALPLSLGALIAVGMAAPAAAQTFEGPYVGAQAGWSQNRLGQVETDLGTATIEDSRDAATQERTRVV